VSAQTDVAALPNRVAFAGFRGESFGRVGSRRFANELKSFSCDAGASVNATNSASGFAFCQSPLRTDLAFTNLTTAGLAHVIAVDQVGCAKENKGYVHPAVRVVFSVHWVKRVNWSNSSRFEFL
jgi:hypothetical protein